MIFALLGAAVLAGQLAFEVDQQIDRAAEDERADHRLLGRALAGSIGAAWQDRGKEQALELLERSNRLQDQVFVRWVWVDGRSSDAAPRVALERLDPLARSGYLGFEVDEGGKPVLVSYVPVEASGRLGAIEISEPVPVRRQLAWRAARSLAIAAVLLGGLFLIATVVIGRQLIGRPVQALVELAQQLEVGNLKARCVVNRSDELGLLAGALNKMAAGLEEAKAQIAAETAARHEAEENVRHVDRLATVGKLAAGLAHELGTPLNVVDGRARMIAAGQVEGRAAADSARIISEQVASMTRIIRQLLDFARRRPPNRTRQQLEPLVKRTLDLLEPLASRRKVKLIAEVPAETELSIDAGELNQVVTNLVLNAIQAMERPGEVRIRAAFEQRSPPAPLEPGTRGWVRLEVEDTGPGLPPEVRAHLFEPFFTTKGVGEGTGLGLSVSYGIVRDHGGWIAVDPAFGGGTRFCVFLPDGSG